MPGTGDVIPCWACAVHVPEGKMKLLLLSLLLLLGGGLSGVRGLCSFPSTLVGKTMVSNTLGEITFAENSVVLHEGIRTCEKCPPPPYTFECRDYGPANEYWIVSETLTLGNMPLIVHMCWDLIQVTDEKWIYYQGPKEFDKFYFNYAKGRWIIPQPPPPVTMDKVCNLTTPRPANTYHVLLDSATLRSQFSSCPDALLGTFEATDMSTSCVTTLDVCSTATRHTVTVSDPTDCSANKFYSTDGKMDCLHSMSQNNVIYVMMYTPEATNVTFSCMILLQEGNNLYITSAAGSCDGHFDSDPLIALSALTKTAYEHFLNATSHILQIPNVTFHHANSHLCPFPCTFPAALDGTWVSTQKGTVTVASTQLTGLFGTETLECYRTEGNSYLIRTEVRTDSSEDVRDYMCLQLTQKTANKYLYYERRITKDATLNDYLVTFNAGQSMSLAQACEDLSGSPYKATRHHLLLKSGTEGDSYVTCPDALLGVFNDTVNGCMFESCEDTTKLSVTRRTCDPKPFYSGEGTLGCLYSVSSSGTTYVTVHNADATTDGVDTHQFSCLAFKKSGTTLKLTQNPKECLDDQTSESIATNHTFTYVRTEDCPTEDEFDWLLVVIIVLVILFIIIAVIIIVCIICRIKRKRKQKQEDEETAVLAKDEDDFGTNRSTDSGYGVSPRTTSGPGSRKSRRGVGTPMSHYVETYEVPEEEGPKQHNTVVSKLKHRHGHRTGKDGTSHEPRYESDGETNYSDASWEEYVDEEGNTQVRPKEKEERKRKKKKHTYTKTHVLEDGTMIEEEVESEYSVSASASSEAESDEGEDLGEKIREAKERRRARLGIIMAMDMTDTENQPIVTREMDEKKHQPELEMNNTLGKKLKKRARDLKGGGRYDDDEDDDEDYDDDDYDDDSFRSSRSAGSSRDSSPTSSRRDRGSDDEDDEDEVYVNGVLVTKTGKKKKKKTNKGEDGRSDSEGESGTERRKKGGGKHGDSGRERSGSAVSSSSSSAAAAALLLLQGGRGPSGTGGDAEEGGDDKLDDGTTRRRTESGGGEDEATRETDDKSGKRKGEDKHRDKSKSRSRSRSKGRKRVGPDSDDVVVWTSGRTGSGKGRRGKKSSERDEDTQRSRGGHLKGKGRGGKGGDLGDQAITTREMDEKKNQPERKKGRSLLNRLRGRARGLKDGDDGGKAKKRGLFKGRGANGVVPGSGEGNEIPYLLQYQKKKELEQVLTDEGFFDDPKDRGTSEADYGFLQMDRELTPALGRRQGKGPDGDGAGDSSKKAKGSRKLGDLAEEGDDVRRKGDDAKKRDGVKTTKGDGAGAGEGDDVDKGEDVKEGDDVRKGDRVKKGDEDTGRDGDDVGDDVKKADGANKIGAVTKDEGDAVNKGDDVKKGGDVSKSDDVSKDNDAQASKTDVGTDGTRHAENQQSAERGKKFRVLPAIKPSAPGDSDATKKDRRHHHGTVSPASVESSSYYSSDDGEEGERKSSDTSSGVADLSNDQQSSADRGRRAAQGNHRAQGHQKGGILGEDRERRISLGREKLQALHSRNKLHSDWHGDDDDKRSHSRHGHRGKKSKGKKDKRVKTALRRLLNERLFGSSDKKKSRRDDDTTESWTNSDSADNNHRGRHGHGKGGADGQKDAPESADDPNSKRRVRLAFGPGHHDHDDPNAADDENEENGGAAGQGRERPPHMRPLSMLPPLRMHQLPVSRVFTPAHYPKWHIYVTATQRNMLKDGLHRDKSFLSRTQARSAWGSRGDTGTSLSSRSIETGRGGTATEDEAAADPHRPDSESVHSTAGSESQWATKRKAKPVHDGDASRSVTFTESSGRSPLDYDDRRLRRLLEELYRDKKFMDKLINKIDEEHLEFPDHIAADDVKFLSEFGRRYLLERADYWELNGPLGPPRGPQSALGARLARSQTSSTVSPAHPNSTQEVASPRPYTVR